MTKDQEIAMLHAVIERLQEDKLRLVDTLQLALGPKPLAPSTARTRAWRERHSDRSRDVRGGLIGGATVLLSEDVTKKDGDQEGTPITGESAERGKRHGDVPDPDWDAFREAYPKKTHRSNWHKTRQRWDRLSKADRAAAVVGARNYAPSRDVLSTGEMGAQRFLNERTWEQHQEPELALPVASRNGHKPDPQAGVQEWLARSREAENIIEGEMA